MALSLKDPETDRLARAVAALTGETLTAAVRKALAERLERERLRRGEVADLVARLRRSASIAPVCQCSIRVHQTRSAGMTKTACGPDDHRHVGNRRDLLREPEAEEFNRRIAETPVRLISAVTRVESSFVIEGRFGEPGRIDLNRLLTDTRIEIAWSRPNKPRSRSMRSAATVRAATARGST